MEAVFLLQRFAWALWTLLVVLPPSAVSAGAAAETSISGRWKLVLVRRDRRRKFRIVFRQEGTRVSGSFVDRRGRESLIEVGSFKDGKLEFQVKREFEGKPRVFTIAAELKDSGKMQGRISMDGRDVGRVVFTRRARRAEPAPIVPLEELAGTWYALAATPGGAKKDCQLVLTAKNGQLAGKFRFDGRSTELRDIRLKGDKLQFLFPFRLNDVDTLVRVEAQLHDNGLLKGKWTASSRESGEFTAQQPVEL
jgi:hypothetical protein